MKKIKEKTVQMYKHLKNLRTLYEYGVRNMEIISKNEIRIKHIFEVNGNEIPGYVIPDLKNMSESDNFIIEMSFPLDETFKTGIKIVYDEDITEEIYDYFKNEISKEISKEISEKSYNV